MSLYIPSRETRKKNSLFIDTDTSQSVENKNHNTHENLVDMDAVLRKFGIDPNALVLVPLNEYYWNKFATVIEPMHVDPDDSNVDKEYLPTNSLDVSLCTISQRIKQLRRTARPNTQKRYQPCGDEN